MKPVFGYLRVSGRNQIGGDGFERQRTTIEAYCTAKGLKVIRWFQDGAVSGEVDTADRDGFAEMMMLVGPGTTQTVLVERADRLGRTLAVCEIACEEARKSGVQILEAASDTDLTNSDDPTRVLIRQVLGSLAEWNKNVMVKRLRAARDRIRVEKGRCEGFLPFGQRGNPADEEALSFIFTMKLRDYSLREMACELNRRHIPSPAGGVWHKSSIAAVMKGNVQPIPATRGSKLLAGLAV